MDFDRRDYGSRNNQRNGGPVTCDISVGSAPNTRLGGGELVRENDPNGPPDTTPDDSS